jgi:NAD(P)-dependent dehydrogenase (short-subunit alcohol dehydrogenase family)
MSQLQGKVALVTGAGRGIGREIAYQLAKAGARVVINYAHSKQAASELVETIQSENLQGTAIKADVSVVEEIEQMVAKTVDLYGQLDILVNNAGIDPTEDFFQVTESFWKRVVHTNLMGTFFVAQACAREMVKRGKGRIINISSVHGQLTMPRYAVYASTKGAITEPYDN